MPWAAIGDSVTLCDPSANAMLVGRRCVIDIVVIPFRVIDTQEKAGQVVDDHLFV
jgi:hypothetical protein